MTLPPVSLIGTGALGGTLLKAFGSAGLKVAGAYNRTPGRAEQLLGRGPAGEETAGESAGARVSGRSAKNAGDIRIAAFPEGKDELAKLILIAVADDAVVSVAERLAALGDSWEGYAVAHCSGALTSGVLDPLRSRGAGTASFHPLQTFTCSSGSSHFEGIWFSSEGDDTALVLLEELAGRLGGSMLRVEEGDKPRIHLAAVFASNYLVSLMQLAGKAGSGGGIGERELMRALAPLMRQAARNIAEEGPAGALSGPIARGDASTVERHLDLLESDPELREQYRALGRELLDVVKKSKKPADLRTLQYLEQLLER